MSDTGTTLTAYVLATLGILATLGSVLIALKLLHAIALPWVWVLAPFWGGFAFALAVLLVIVIATLIEGARG